MPLVRENNRARLSARDRWIEGMVSVLSQNEIGPLRAVDGLGYVMHVHTHTHIYMHIHCISA